jgi:hypothetical protein
MTTQAELTRRTPNTTLDFNYLGNYAKSDGVENANNLRVNATYDIRLNKDWFLRPADFEYYHDPLANIDYRLTGGVGAGYYIFDRTGLEWRMAAGPSFQYTKFSTVETNQRSPAQVGRHRAAKERYVSGGWAGRAVLIQTNRGPASQTPRALQSSQSPVCRYGLSFSLSVSRPRWISDFVAESEHSSTSAISS